MEPPCWWNPNPVAPPPFVNHFIVNHHIYKIDIPLQSTQNYGYGRQHVLSQTQLCTQNLYGPMLHLTYKYSTCNRTIALRYNVTAANHWKVILCCGVNQSYLRCSVKQKRISNLGISAAIHTEASAFHKAALIKEFTEIKSKRRISFQGYVIVILWWMWFDNWVSLQNSSIWTSTIFL